MSQRRSRSSLPAVVILLFITSLGITILVLFNTVSSYTKTAQELYGPASEQLFTIQRYRLSYQLIQDQSLLLNPHNPQGEQTLFRVELGEPPDSILNRLEQNNLIPSRPALLNYLIFTGLDTRLQAGEFYLNPALSPVAIINLMLDPAPQVIDFSVLPGWRVEEIAASLPASGLNILPDQFMRAANTRPAEIGLAQELPFGVSLEGYLMPGSYKIPRTTDADSLVLAMLENFEAQVTLEMRAGFSRQGLNLHQAITLASIIQREAVLEDEQPLIASVLLNRIAQGMKLETDPTVQYALGYNDAQNTWWTNPLSFADLEFNSPYNTYIYPGLPPGPIANPSISTIQAVAYPAQSPYFFFRAACDNSGRHSFAVTFEEHLANGCQ